MPLFKNKLRKRSLWFGPRNTIKQNFSVTMQKPIALNRATLEQVMFLKSIEENELQREIRNTEKDFSAAKNGHATFRATMLEEKLGNLYKHLMIKERSKH